MDDKILFIFFASFLLTLCMYFLFLVIHEFYRILRFLKNDNKTERN